MQACGVQTLDGFVERSVSAAADDPVHVGAVLPDDLLGVSLRGGHFDDGSFAAFGDAHDQIEQIVFVLPDS